MSRSHRHDLAPFTHTHRFDDAAAPSRARALWWVTAITLATMALELAAGYWAGSLALVADGWHMGTHALALGGAALAAVAARRAHRSTRFSFGGWKIEVLAAYTSGLLLLAVGVWIGVDALRALAAPRTVAYGEAMVVAAIGLAVNLVCAAILARSGGQGQAHAHAHAHGDHAHHHHDHNYAAAYLHVVADAFTSVLAIVALAGGLWWGLAWFDPTVALVGAIVIGRWAAGVLRESGGALVDASAPPHLAAQVRTLIEADGDAELADLHLWQVGPGCYAAALSIVADAPLAAAAYTERLKAVHALRHATIEVHRCPGDAALPKEHA